MHNSLYLGFDGGATKTTGIAMDDGWNIVAEAIGGPSNFQIIGTEKASSNVLEVVETLLRKASCDFSDVRSLYLAVAGAGRIADADMMRDAFIDLLRSKGYSIPEIAIGSDAIAALEGAFSGRPGMILISGTGSILFAKDRLDRIHRAGGWGRVIGDEGSGYSIGQACLSAIARQLDGREKVTSMWPLFQERLRIQSSQDLIAAVYQNKLDIASLALIVIEAAERGDEVAGEILSKASIDLCDLIDAVLRQLDVPVPLVLCGSLLESDNSFSQKLKLSIKTRFPHLKIQEPDHSPAVGAALLAVKKIGPS